MEIIWSPLALEDIEIIGDFIAEDNPERAISFVDEMITSVERLVEFPESGRVCEEHPLFRQLVFESYRLIYQLRVDKILIVTVLGPGQSFKTT